MAGVIVDLVQGTPEWLAWRFSGIGGSDAPAVLGKSPYKTALQMAKEKIAKREVQDDSKEYIFGQGHKSEAIARKAFEDLTGEPCKPVCMVHPEYSELIVSLDGFNQQHGLLEAKLVPAATLKAIAEKGEGEIPEHHIIQMHHGFNITGADLGQWYGRDTKGNGVLIEVKKRKQFAKDLQDQVLEFWANIQNGILPPLSSEDYLEPEDVTKLAELRDAKELMENAEIAYELLKKEVIESYSHNKIAGAGIKIFKTEKAGSIPWTEIPEVAKVIERIKAKKKGAYAESFRKKGSTSWTVSFDKIKKGTKDEQ